MDLKRKILLSYCSIIRSGFKRAKLFKKVNYFHHQGENCFFSTLYFGTEPHLISFGDNVHVAAGARFVTHDVTGNMLNFMCPEKHVTNRVGKIEIGNHVVIGANAVILYDVKIGDRVVIGAGSVVTTDIPDGSVYAGVPARKIGTSEDYYEKIRKFSDSADWDESVPISLRKELQKEYFWKERGR